LRSSGDLKSAEDDVDDTLTGFGVARGDGGVRRRVEERTFREEEVDRSEDAGVEGHLHRWRQGMLRGMSDREKTHLLADESPQAIDQGGVGDGDGSVVVGVGLESGTGEVDLRAARAAVDGQGHLDGRSIVHEVDGAKWFSVKAVVGGDEELADGGLGVVANRGHVELNDLLAVPVKGK
jgi:hypothetical protein